MITQIILITDKGADALNTKIANMTIGELEAMLDLQNVDPVLAFNLLKDMKQLFAVIVSVKVSKTMQLLSCC